MRGRSPLFITVIFLILFAVSHSGAGRAAGSPIALEEVRQRHHRAPFLFVENNGRFQLRAARSTLWLDEQAIWITVLEPAGNGERHALEHHAASREAAQTSGRLGVNLRLSFVGANPSPELQPFDPLTTTVSNFSGSDPEKWQADAPVWGGVRYANLYPGLDLELAGQGGRLAPRLVCRAADCEAALESVQLQVEGAEALVVEGYRLRMSSAVGDFHLPLLQAVDATGRPLVMSGLRPSVANNRMTRPYASYFSASSRSPMPQLPNDDPADLLYSTFLGGGANDTGFAIAVDGAGNAYVTGGTVSIDFPTTPGAFDVSHNSSGWQDVFVAKLDPDGSDVLYATFLGGDHIDVGYGIAVDAAGNAYVSGVAYSSNFPTTPGAFDTTHNSDGFTDVFVAKVNPAGSQLLYATFLGGSLDDSSYAMAVDAAGSATVTGRTASTNFPATTGAYDDTPNGDYDLFVARLNAAGSDLLYATFLGGDGPDEGYGMAVDGAGNAYVTGRTLSSNFPTTPDAFDSTHNGFTDAFVAKLNAAGSDLLYATYLGGSIEDMGRAIAVDGAGNAYVTGGTGSADFPVTAGAFDTSRNSGIGDGFVVKVNAAGGDLLYATYLGGNVPATAGAMPEGAAGAASVGLAIKVDEAGSAIVSGSTSFTDFPVTPGAFDTSYNGYTSDAFVTKFNPAGSALLYSTFLGGSHIDAVYAMAVDAAGDAYVTGLTYSTDFPTTPGALDANFNGGFTDSFVARLTLEANTNLYDVYAPAFFRPLRSELSASAPATGAKRMSERYQSAQAF